MSTFKNTPITGLNELVIDGRTKSIQWKKYDDDWWYEANFQTLAVNREMISDSIGYYLFGAYKNLPRVKVLPHGAMMHKLHRFDTSARCKTWISGHTFNVKLLKYTNPHWVKKTPKIYENYLQEIKPKETKPAVYDHKSFIYEYLKCCDNF